jgi:hypothetical protein
MRKLEKRVKSVEIEVPQEVLSEHWRDLRVGDRIRIVKLPWYANLPDYTFPQCTRQLFKKLIARRRSLRICKVDKDGLPWIHCRFRMKNGLWEYHGLMMNDDSWVRVKSRL